MARKGMSDRPIEKISPVEFRESYPKKGRGKKTTHRKGQSNRQGQYQRKGSGKEQGMVRLSLPKGKSHGINPGEIVGGIASLANIPGSGIGKITIQENKTLIDVKENFVPAVLKKSGSYHFRDNHHVDIVRSN